MIKNFINPNQLAVIRECIREEEGKEYKEKLEEIATIISKIPKLYEQDGKGNNAIVYLHYFRGSANWYILERDLHLTEPQYQAFSYGSLVGDDYEYGYVNIEELLENDIELDLYFEPKTLREVKESLKC